MAAIAGDSGGRVASLADKFDMPGCTTFPAFYWNPSLGVPVWENQMAKLRKSDLLTTTETAEGLRLTISTLENMRWQGTGPRFYKLGGRVFYHIDDLREWLRQMRRRCSSGDKA